MHLLKGPCTAGHTESKLRRTPVLLDKIQFTVILGIIITQVAARFDVLLEQRFLRCKIELGVKKVTTAAAGLSGSTLGASTLNRKAGLGPKATLADYLFHTLKPAWILGVVIWEIERLTLPCQRIDAITHAWPFWIVRPKTLGIWEDINKTKKKRTTLTFDHLGDRNGIISAP